MTAVAMLGTGIMGAAMARTLLRDGHQVTVWNRTRSRAEPLAANGATVAGSPAEAVADAEVVITILDGADTAMSVMKEAAPSLRRGQVWAQMGTVGVESVPSLAAFAAEQGLMFVDAPVQGTKQPAEQGKLLVLAAGPQDARSILDPVFGSVGAKTLWLAEDGAGGAGTRLKLAAVSYAISLTSVVAESVALAEGLGLDPALLGEVFTGGPLDNAYLQAKMKAILAGDFEPSFAVRNAEKNTRLIHDAAEAAGIRMDVNDAAGERFRRAIEQGHGDEDMAATYRASFPPGRG
ncbi:NAD(P)-dependent oxidoreductase [Actinomadura livida]|uniref:3-hydroxyisobutyrate dehydrogenase n=1 Tax=Actinomadura livida TaxID=79909 RepID=A0A7W7IEU7_9ACTN|nr:MULTISPECIES: NAD(P)-dependent oxidoreductase [Actinomadura]MBB4775813.1 3-hydroxyisobutyrate dehydrogenase [Actinomadura catellatispora]GGU35472.1 dehydrogenase [Actinomadura livida]